MNIARYVNQSVAALLVASCGAVCLAGCSTAMNVHTASTSQLESQRIEIDREIATDDFGLSWGVSRWVSHATEKSKVLKEKEQIDAELLRRRSGRQNVAITRSPHVAPNVTASSTDNLAEPPRRGSFDGGAVRFAISYSQTSAEQARVCFQSLRPIQICRCEWLPFG